MDNDFDKANNLNLHNTKLLVNPDAHDIDGNISDEQLYSSLDEIFTNDDIKNHFSKLSLKTN